MQQWESARAHGGRAGDRGKRSESVRGLAVLQSRYRRLSDSYRSVILRSLFGLLLGGQRDHRAKTDGRPND